MSHRQHSNKRFPWRVEVAKLFVEQPIIKSQHNEESNKNIDQNEIFEQKVLYIEILLIFKFNIPLLP